jgi:hypothetical protein
MMDEYDYHDDEEIPPDTDEEIVDDSHEESITSPLLVRPELLQLGKKGARGAPLNPLFYNFSPNRANCTKISSGGFFFWLSFLARRAEYVNEVNKRTNEKGL